MKAKELRDLNSEELIVKLNDFKSELFSLRFQLATGQLENTARIISLLPSSFFDLTFEFTKPTIKPKTFIPNKYTSTIPIFINHSRLDDIGI